MRKFLLLVPFVPFLLSACVPLVISGGTETAVAASQERSFGTVIDDNTIFLDIKRLYATKSEGNAVFADVMIKVLEGRVFLTGNVDTPDEELEAVNLAWQAGGVREVVNELQVNDKTGFSDYARDVWISTQVRTRLLLGKGIHSVNYSVITVNSVVYLLGIASSQDELDRAVWVASTTQYVKKVVSHVRLSTDPRRPKAQ